jgi:zinc protease
MPLRHIVEEITLDNGTKGLIIDVPDSTVVAYGFQFRAGYDYTDSSIQQVAHILEHMAVGGNEVFQTSESFSQEFTKNGANKGASTSDRNMIYVAESAYMEWDRILDLMQIAVTRPVFGDLALEAEKGNVREELTGQANNHSRVLWQQVARAMGSDCLVDAEKIETINHIQLGDVKKYYCHTHTLQNMRFTLTGNLIEHKNEIIKKINTWNLPNGQRMAVKKNTPKSSPVVYIYRQELSNLTFIINIILNRELSISEQVTMGALNHILTGTFHSRIFGKARSNGICYSMGSGIHSDISGTSNWFIHGSVGTDNSNALFELIVSQLIKVTEGDISDEELSAAKLFALGRYQMNGQTVNSLSSWYSSYYFDHEKIDPLESSPEYIKSTTIDDVVKLAQEFIDNGHWTLGGIGDISERQLQSHYDLLAHMFEKRVK